MKRAILAPILLIFSLAFVACQPKKPTSRNADRPVIRPSAANMSTEHKGALATVTSSTNARNESLAHKIECPKEVIETLGEDSASFNVNCAVSAVPAVHGQSVNNQMAVTHMLASKGQPGHRQLLVLEQGGPGGSSMILLAYYLRKMPKLLDHFDLLAVEQRGTLWTAPNLTCQDIIDAQLNSPTLRLSDEEERQISQACYDRVKDKIHPDSITTYQIAADIPFVAEKLGYSKFSYFGVSYGTAVGQYLLKFHSDKLDKVVQDSPMVLGREWMSAAVLSLDALFEKNIRLVIEDLSAKGKWSLKEEDTLSFIRNSAESFQKSPLTLSYDYKGQSKKISMDAENFLTVFLSSLLKNFDIEEMDYLFDAVKSQSEVPDWSNEVFGAFAAAYLDVEDKSTEVMYQSVVCREFDVRNIDFSAHQNWESLPQILPDTVREEMLADLTGGPCFLELEPHQNTVVLQGAIEIEHPTLVIGGELDHVTLPEYVNEVTERYSNATTHIFPKISHGVFGSEECINDSIMTYLISGDFAENCRR